MLDEAGLAFIPATLLDGQEKHTMFEREVQIRNSGSLLS
jgi:hypothetical protein